MSDQPVHARPTLRAPLWRQAPWLLRPVVRCALEVALAVLPLPLAGAMIAALPFIVLVRRDPASGLYAAIR